MRFTIRTNLLLSKKSFILIELIFRETEKQPFLIYKTLSTNILKKQKAIISLHSFRSNFRINDIHALSHCTLRCLRQYHADMKILFILPVFLFLANCTSQQVTQPSDTETAITYQTSGSKLIVNATVTNRSAVPLSLVKNANFYSISVRALDPKKDEAINPKIVTYGPAISTEVVNLAPGESTTFTSKFFLRQLTNGPLEVEREFQPYGPRSFMQITDGTLRASFDYSHYPKFLTPKALKKGANFHLKPLRANSTFPRPVILPQVITIPAPSEPVLKPLPKEPETV